MIQICKCCEISKDITEFEWLKNRPSPRKVCKKCRYAARDIKKENDEGKERKQKWHLKNKDRLRVNWERSVYGVCKEDIGVDECMICKSKKRLCIDHCHDSGKVRGIICSKCNFGIAAFKDDPALFIEAIRYILNSDKAEFTRKQ